MANEVKKEKDDVPIMSRTPMGRYLGRSDLPSYRSKGTKKSAEAEYAPADDEDYTKDILLDTARAAQDTRE